MKQETLDKFRTLLTEAADKYLANGGKIISGGFRTNAGSCPITCLLGSDYGELDKSISRLVGDTIYDEQIWSFIYSFDSRQEEPGLPIYNDPQMVALGQELRTKYINESFQGSQEVESEDEPISD